MKNDCVIWTMNSNESDVHEWIIHHLLLGFSHIYIYDDHATPPMSDVIDQLPLEFKNKVTCYRLDDEYELRKIDYEKTPVHDLKYFDAEIYRKNKGNKQRYFANYFIRTHRDVAKYCLFSDIDEYVYLKQDNSIVDFLDKVDTYDYIALPWVYYGTSYYVDNPKGMVMDNFRFNNGYEKETKMIVNLKKAGNMQCIHHFYEKNTRSQYKETYWTQTYDKTTELGTLDIHLNHYITKAYKTGVRKKREHCLGQVAGFDRTIEQIAAMCMGLDLIHDKHIMEKYISRVNNILNYDLNENHYRFGKNYHAKCYYNGIELSYGWLKSQPKPMTIQIIDDILASENVEYK